VKFDRLADRAEKIVSRAGFFAGCVLLILLWAPLIFWLDVNTWQLIINTVTTCITFLLLALLTNTQRRFEKRVDEKLDRIEGSGHATGTEASRREGST
jgi:low affinity Fe/Cu permease